MKIYLLLSMIVLHSTLLAQTHQKAKAMKIESSIIKPGQPIPKKFTCEGENISPPLSFRDIPQETKSLALIVDDPDAPNGTFDHWIVWNLTPQTTSLAEGAKVPMEGKNSYRESRYHGPCPPAGKPHRYFFKLYALDTLLNLPAGSSKAEVEKAMKGHIIEKTESFHGTYQR